MWLEAISAPPEMSSDFGSVFHFAGKIQDMKLKIVLTRKGPPIDLITGAQFANTSTIVCDEVSCTWLQIISRNVTHSDERMEPRIFTTVQNNEGEDPKPAKRAVFNIFAYLGDLADTESNKFHDVLICRLTIFNDRTLTFEPALTSVGYRLESKLGDYHAKVQVWDDQFSSLIDGFSRMDMVALPDAGVFDLGEEKSLTVTYNITISKATDFDFDGISIRWRLLGNATESQQLMGLTSRCFQNKEGVFRFSHLFTITLSIPFSILCSGFNNPTLFLEAISEDGWGRQWVAGYGCFTLPLKQGIKQDKIHCWRPIKPDGNSQLQEFFIGSAVHLDTEKLIKDGFRKMFGLHTESSGIIETETMTIIHSRHFMSKDTLQHVKYGTRLGQIGLKSDLYWRIMKVLLEFEEARQALLQIRQS